MLRCPRRWCRWSSRGSIFSRQAAKPSRSVSGSRGMRTTPYLRFTAGFLLIAAACSSGDTGSNRSTSARAGSVGANLTGAGATFPNPIYTKWFDAYQKETGVRINYQSIGSGGGIRQFTEGTVDFGASDGPMNDDQMQAVGGKVLHVPTVLGAVVLTYNLPGIGNTRLKFDGPTIAGILQGKITK